MLLPCLMVGLAASVSGCVTGFGHDGCGESCGYEIDPGCECPCDPVVPDCGCPQDCTPTCAVPECGCPTNPPGCQVPANYGMGVPTHLGSPAVPVAPAAPVQSAPANPTLSPLPPGQPGVIRVPNNRQKFEEVNRGGPARY